MILCVALIAVTIGVFLQTADHRFINFDDPGYVTENPRVKGGLTGENVAWAFSATAMSNWHPLTWLSHMTDVQLFGLNPRGHHLTSVFLHVATTALLFFLLAQITGAPWQSLFVAALFALHPLHVESVAWVAERKDVLSGFFWFLTLLLYARYVERPGHVRYLLALLSFAAGLMAKPMLVTLPVVMLLLDGWPLKRFTWGEAREGAAPKNSLAALVIEKIPFFLLAAMSSAVTIHAQHAGGALKTLEAAPFGPRLANAPVAYATYITKTFWPLDLALLYPFSSSIPAWRIVGALVVLGLVTVGLLRVRRRHPYMLAGWCWFLVTLLPVIGLVQVGGQSMADRYTYIPLTGLFIMVGWGIPDLLQGLRYRQVLLAVLAGSVLFASAALTWRQLGYWKGNLSLYRHTLDVTTGNYLILNNYGIALAQEGRLDEAILQYQEALRIWPNSANAHVNMGAALAHQGKYAEAIGHYNEALRRIPDYALAHGNLGKALASLGRLDEAIAHYDEALRLDPSLADVHLNLAILLMQAGMRDEASQHYEAVLRLEPYSVKAPINMGIAMARQGKLDEAAGFFAQALRIDPASVEAHFNLGVVLARQNRVEEAAHHFSEVLRLKPDTEAARRWLEVLERQPKGLSPK